MNLNFKRLLLSHGVYMDVHVHVEPSPCVLGLKAFKAVKGLRKHSPLTEHVDGTVGWWALECRPG